MLAWKDAPEEVALHDDPPGVPRLAGDPGEEEEPEPERQKTEEATTGFGGAKQRANDEQDEGG